MDVGDVKLYRIIYIYVIVGSSWVIREVIYIYTCMMFSVEQILKCHGVKNQSFATDCYPGIGDLTSTPSKHGGTSIVMMS